MGTNKQPSHADLSWHISDMVNGSSLDIDRYTLCPLNNHNYHLKIVHKNGYVWRMQFKMHEWEKGLELLSSYLEPL